MMKKVSVLRISYLSVTSVGQQTGKIHRKQNIKIQDVSFIGEKDGIAVFGLADGQGKTDLCSVGGREVLQTVAEYIWSLGFDNLSSFRYHDELQYALLTRIRRKIDELTEVYQLDDNSELSSTLLMIAIDTYTGRYVSVHIGDGIVIGIRKDNAMVLVSRPDNGITSQYTWFTTSDTAMHHLRIDFGSVEGYKRFFLVTDGAELLCNGSFVFPEAQSLMTDGTLESVIAYMNKSEPNDDASLIAIEIGPKDSITGDVEILANR